MIHFKLGHFLDPKTDFVFKKIFGTNKDLVKSFLNSILPFEKDTLIESLEYLSPKQEPYTPFKQYSLVVVRCIDKKGRIFIVEMQGWSPSLRARIQFDETKTYVSQFDKSDNYELINPVYSLGLIGEIFDTNTSNWYHHYKTVNIKNTDHQIRALELIFVELPKFKDIMHLKQNIGILWLRFFNEIDQIKDIPKEFGKIPEIKKAIELTQKDSFSPEQLVEYEGYWDQIRVKQAVLEKEMAYKHACLIESTLPENEKKSTIAILKEKLDENPQAIFFADINGTRYVGRKYISDSVIYHGLPGLFCSKIKKDMILGKYRKDRITQDFIIVYFEPILHDEKDQVFSKLLSDRNVDIWYPYVQLISDKKLEKTTPDEGWVVDPNRAYFLGMGEESIRAYTLTILPTLFPNIHEDVITVYDPACSTGQFLESIYKVYPHIRVVGQELSANMVDLALQKIPEVYHGNSLHSCMPAQSVDLIVFRFLNNEVVTTAQSYDLFDALIKTVKKGGYLILFGHTPILIDLEWLQFYGLTVIRTNGLSQDDQSIFQYYILQN